MSIAVLILLSIALSVNLSEAGFGIIRKKSSKDWKSTTPTVVQSCALTAVMCIYDVQGGAVVEVEKPMI